MKILPDDPFAVKGMQPVERSGGWEPRGSGRSMDGSCEVPSRNL